MQAKKLKDKIEVTFRNYTFIMKILWKSAPALLCCLIILTLSDCALPVVAMLLTKTILDLLASSVKAAGVLPILLVLICGNGLLGIAQQLIAGMKGYLGSQILTVVGKDMTYLIQEKAAALDLKFFDTPAYYQKLENVRRVLNRNWDFLLVAPITFIGSAISLFTMTGILSSYNAWLIPVIMLGVCPNIAVQLSMRRKINTFYTEQIPESRKIGYTENLLSDRYFAKEVRIFGLTGYILDMARGLFRDQYSKIKKIQSWQLKTNFTWNSLAALTLLACQVLISISAFYGKITIGSWQMYSQAAFSIRTALSSLFGIVADSYEQDFYTNILKDFMETKPGIDPVQGKTYIHTGKAPVIEFKNVSFAYPGSCTMILQDIDFTIRPGEKIALVGLNGSGKTTLVKLLTRLYDPTGGAILFNGTNIKTYKAQNLYKLFGVIFQDFSRYAFTLKENIGISSLDKMDNSAALAEAAAVSGTDRIAARLDQGYNTYITKAFDLNGCPDLSGGEWQKIAIARCFFSAAPIVILDEPTASLDPEAEYEVYNQFIRLCRDKTGIIISHRLSSVRMADRIFLIKDNMLYEAGTHHELMRKKGEYARLFLLQAGQYRI